MQYIQSARNICSIVLKSDGFSGWIGIGFLKDGSIMDSTAVGWTGGYDLHNNRVEPGIQTNRLRPKVSENVRSDAVDFYFVDIPPFVMWDNNTFYMGFQARMDARLDEQDMILFKNDQGVQPSLKNDVFEELKSSYAHQYVAKVNFTREYNHSKGLLQKPHSRPANSDKTLILFGLREN